MPRESFESAMIHVFEHEGEIYENDPDDPGGETKYGICKRYHPDVDIFNLTKEQAKEIYLNTYWIPNGCDKLPFPLDVIFFDCCINPGPSAAKIMLYKAKGDSDTNWQCVMLTDLRIRYYMKRIKDSPAMAKYIQGWIDRSLDILEETVLTMELFK